LPASGSPTVRRRELGARLRALRTDRGWTVEQLAERLQFSPSKVSRLENGRRGVSATDIRDLCDLYNVQGDERQQLIDLAAEGKQRAWWQSHNLPYSHYVGLENAAASIRDYGLGLIPGLLQTSDYGRAALSAFFPQLDAEVIEQRLAGRIERQRLLAQDNGPEFEALLDEAVLHRVGGSHAIMRAQLQHLLDAGEMPRVTIRVLPWEAGILPVSQTKFIILSFREPSVPGVVFIEGTDGLTGNLYLGPGEGLAEYEEVFTAMWSMSATPERSRQMIVAIASSLEG
jgi:transcriptional regulator with XRE-family HTH domain